MSKERKGADHGEFPILHQAMLGKMSEWIDEFCLREHGFRLSELQQAEAILARYVTSTTLTAEGVEERERVLENYRKVWRHRRLLLDSIF